MSPSQWPGTSRSAASAGRSRIKPASKIRLLGGRWLTRQGLGRRARRRGARKRAGADDADVDVRIDDLPLGITTSYQLLALDDALKVLAQTSDRRAQVVEARFVGGLTVAEIAQMLGVSEITVQRDWRLARAWLTTPLRDAYRATCRRPIARSRYCLADPNIVRSPD